MSTNTHVNSLLGEVCKIIARAYYELHLIRSQVIERVSLVSRKAKILDLTLGKRFIYMLRRYRACYPFGIGKLIPVPAETNGILDRTDARFDPFIGR